MKKIILILIWLFAAKIGNTQTAMDSMLKIIRTSTIDSIRTDAAMNIVMPFGYMSPNAVLYYSDKLKVAAQESHFPAAEALSFATRGFALMRLNSQADALENGLKGLKLAEKYPNYRALSIVYNGLGLIYNSTDDQKGMYYFFMALEAAKKSGEHKEKSIILTNIGSTFLKRELTDSALIFLQQAYELLIRKEKIWDDHFVQSSRVWVLTLIGRTHLKLGHKDLAETYNRMALKDALSSNYDASIQLYAYTAMADFFEATEQIDSAFLYNKFLMNLAMHNNYSWEIKPGYYLYKYYKNKKNDSALKYLETYTIAKQKADSSENLSRVHSLSFEEDVRQKELLTEKEKMSLAGKNNLEYAAIAIVLIAFIILFLLLSRSIIVKTKFIEFFGVLGLLAVFEFINLFIHPYLAHATNDSPVLMLVVLIAIGALLIPLHHKLEKWITKIMVEKNKKIRLAAAKKTIAQLEGEERIL